MRKVEACCLFSESIKMKFKYNIPFVYRFVFVSNQMCLEKSINLRFESNFNEKIISNQFSIEQAYLQLSGESVVLIPTLR